MRAPSYASQFLLCACHNIHCRHLPGHIRLCLSNQQPVAVLVRSVTHGIASPRACAGAGQGGGGRGVGREHDGRRAHLGGLLQSRQRPVVVLRVQQVRRHRVPNMRSQTTTKMHKSSATMRAASNVQVKCERAPRAVQRTSVASLSVARSVARCSSSSPAG